MALAKLGPVVPAALGELLQGRGRRGSTRGRGNPLGDRSPDKTATATLVELLENREDQSRPPRRDLPDDGLPRRGEGLRRRRLPAWNDYRKLVGDTPVSHRLFGDMLRAEPELSTASAAIRSGWANCWPSP